jgi:hypothetical protein
LKQQDQKESINEEVGNKENDASFAVMQGFWG